MTKPRILIVDDEERFRTTLAKRLIQRDLEIDTVGSGVEALEALKKKLFDVVLLDVKMPGLDGIETLTEIKKISAGIEVVMLTGHASVESAVDGMRMGAYDYLMKPCEIDHLMVVLEGAHEVKAARDERLRQAEVRKLVDRKPG